MFRGLKPNRLDTRHSVKEYVIRYDISYEKGFIMGTGLTQSIQRVLDKPLGYC